MEKMKENVDIYRYPVSLMIQMGITTATSLRIPTPEETVQLKNMFHEVLFGNQKRKIERFDLYVSEREVLHDCIQPTVSLSKYLLNDTIVKSIIDKIEKEDRLYMFHYVNMILSTTEVERIIGHEFVSRYLNEKEN